MVFTMNLLHYIKELIMDTCWAVSALALS